MLAGRSSASRLSSSSCARRPSSSPESGSREALREEALRAEEYASDSPSSSSCTAPEAASVPCAAACAAASAAAAAPSGRGSDAPNSAAGPRAGAGLPWPGTGVGLCSGSTSVPGAAGALRLRGCVGLEVPWPSAEGEVLRLLPRSPPFSLLERPALPASFGSRPSFAAGRREASPSLRVVLRCREEVPAASLSGLPPRRLERLSARSARRSAAEAPEGGSAARFLSPLRPAARSRSRSSRRSVREASAAPPAASSRRRRSALPGRSAPPSPLSPRSPRASRASRPPVLSRPRFSPFSSFGSLRSRSRSFSLRSPFSFSSRSRFFRLLGEGRLVRPPLPALAARLSAPDVREWRPLLSPPLDRLAGVTSFLGFSNTVTVAFFPRLDSVRPLSRGSSFRRARLAPRELSLMRTSRRALLSRSRSA